MQSPADSLSRFCLAAEWGAINMKVVRVGALRPASALCALSAGALMASTTPIAFQDMAALLSDVKPAERWQSHMVAAPQGSVHAATFQFFDQSSSYQATDFGGIRIPAMPQGGLVAIARDEGAAANGAGIRPDLGSERHFFRL
jgi:hypothetical protein